MPDTATLLSSPVKKCVMNVVGPQVRKLRNQKGWSQETLAAKLQLIGWSIGRDSVASLESQRRRVPDCEIIFMARALGVRTETLFPRNLVLRKLGPQFQNGRRLAVFPTRGER
jgi:transcriptional regulator with XRE-family HTH domain